jgi:HAD superfamily hydrolase (TIGR01484 family)
VSLRPVEDFERATAQAVHTVWTDIDDTLSLHGRLPAAAYGALERLQAAGLRVIPVTGRPAGWCDHIARFWPVDGVIGENGAFYMWHDAPARVLRSRHWLTPEQQALAHQRLAQVQARILAEVPGCAVASDQFCRLYDLAIDFCEDVPALPTSAVDRIAALMQEAGMTAKVSSIHVNGWLGDWDKLAMARLMLAERFGLDLEQEADCMVFVGDSPNDAPMFAAFPNAVGVANVRDCLDRLTHRPTWVTQAQGGLGFVEFVDRLLALRGD